MKKRLLGLTLAVVMAAGALAGCGGAKKESWKVTCPWAPSGVAAMVSQKAAEKSPSYSEKITLVAEAVKGDAATVNTWVAACFPLLLFWIRQKCSLITATLRM